MNQTTETLSPKEKPTKGHRMTPELEAQFQTAKASKVMQGFTLSLHADGYCYFGLQNMNLHHVVPVQIKSAMEATFDEVAGKARFIYICKQLEEEQKASIIIKTF